MRFLRRLRPRWTAFLSILWDHHMMTTVSESNREISIFV
jgi:hypothetical protein